MSFKRKTTQKIQKSIKKDHQNFHAIIGPRQVGKTTAAEQIANSLKWPKHIISADSPIPPGPEWLQTQWQTAIEKTKRAKNPVLLIIDEIQKVQGWSETIKSLWDTHKKHRKKLRLIILGSSALLVQKDLTESLAGRFLLHRMTHWSYPECKEAFNWTLNEWIYFGGYPGAAIFKSEEDKWKSYIRDSLIETVLAKDVLSMHNITKPALLRNLFLLSCTYPAQILSYTKMLGELQDAGNTTTLANYIKLLEHAFLLSGLERFSKGEIRKRGTSPKLIIWNNALINALSFNSFQESLSDHSWWGRLVENAVGLVLQNNLQSIDWQLSYWREKNQEVDFILKKGQKIWAIEVKSSRTGKLSGLEKFLKKYPTATPLIIGSKALPLEEFFTHPPEYWLK